MALDCYNLNAQLLDTFRVSKQGAPSKKEEKISPARVTRSNTKWPFWRQ